MKTIQGVKKPITLPDCWEDLTPALYTFTITKLLEVMAHACTLTDFRISLLLKYTGYRPSVRLRPVKPQIRETINENLVRLAGLITFPLRSGKNGTEVNNCFKRNPIPEIRIGKKSTKANNLIRGSSCVPILLPGNLPMPSTLYGLLPKQNRKNA